MRILFVGSREKGYFVEETAGKHHWECAYINADQDIRSQVQDILKEQNVEYIVYDIAQYGNPSEVIAEVISRIEKANNAKPIIHAEGYNAQMAIIRHLFYTGVNAFIFASMLADKKEELEQCIQGTNQVLEYTDEDADVKEETSSASDARTIGVAGAIQRMGTTTQAIQFVKYLLFKGYRACYVQMNNHKWVEELKEAYENVECDEEIGRVTYQNVDMFYRLEKLPEVLKKEYDFYVYDYGVYSEWDFNKISFLEKDLQVFVVGTKPGEFMKTYELIENNFYNNVFYIFNFIREDETEYNDTYELMQGKEDVTFFAADCRDPFVYSGCDIYERMLPLDSIVIDEKPVKRGFFRRKRR